MSPAYIMTFIVCPLLGEGKSSLYWYHGTIIYNTYDADKIDHILRVFIK